MDQARGKLVKKYNICKMLMAYLFPIGIRVYTEESISLKLEACVNLSTNHRFIYHCIVYSPKWVLSSKDDIKSYNDNYRLVTMVRGQIKILILGLHLEVRWVARSRFFSHENKPYLISAYLSPGHCLKTHLQIFDFQRLFEKFLFSETKPISQKINKYIHMCVCKY